MITVAHLLIAILAFVTMEAVSYATHRWLMHGGVGMAWHRSHHSPATPGWERNDLFPVLFSLIGFVVFLTASLIGSPALFWAGGGVAAYGATYLFVHEIYIHQRLPLHVSKHRYLEWLRQSHRIHHLFGGEPFGMLLPIVPRSLRERAERSVRFESDDVRPERRESIRVIRSRL